MACAVGKFLGDCGTLMVITQMMRGEVRFFQKIRNVLIRAVIKEYDERQKLSSGRTSLARGLISSSSGLFRSLRQASRDKFSREKSTDSCGEDDNIKMIPVPPLPGQLGGHWPNRTISAESASLRHQHSAESASSSTGLPPSRPSPETLLPRSSSETDHSTFPRSSTETVPNQPLRPRSLLSGGEQCSAPAHSPAQSPRPHIAPLTAGRMVSGESTSDSRMRSGESSLEVSPKFFRPARSSYTPVHSSDAESFEEEEAFRRAAIEGRHSAVDGGSALPPSTALCRRAQSDSVGREHASALDRIIPSDASPRHAVRRMVRSDAAAAAPSGEGDPGIVAGRRYLVRSCSFLPPSPSAPGASSRAGEAEEDVGRMLVEGRHAAASGVHSSSSDSLEQVAKTPAEQAFVEMALRKERIRGALLALLKVREVKVYNWVLDAAGVPHGIPVWIDDAMRYWLERARRRILERQGQRRAGAIPLVSYARGQRGLGSLDAQAFDEVVTGALEVEESRSRMEKHVSYRVVAG